MEFPFVSDPEPLLATLAQLFANEGQAKAVAILANSQATLQYSSHDNWDGGIDIYNFHLQIPSNLYSQVANDLSACEKQIHERAAMVLRPYTNFRLDAVSINPAVTADKDWREKAQAWVSGEGVNNQGRVRSDNVAPKTSDGLLFRSEQEILLYKALKSSGVSFAPLPVFIHGGTEYRRIEPDFVVIKDGIILVVEVDGDTVHHETPAEAHARTTMLVHEGAHVERVKASECGTVEDANICAKKLLTVIEKLKALR